MSWWAAPRHCLASAGYDCWEKRSSDTFVARIFLYLPKLDVLLIFVQDYGPGGSDKLKNGGGSVRIVGRGSY